MRQLLGTVWSQLACRATNESELKVIKIRLQITILEHFQITFRSLQITIRSLLDHYQITFRSLLDHFQITIRSLLDHFQITLDHFQITIRSLLDHYQIILDHFQVTNRALIGHRQAPIGHRQATDRGVYVTLLSRLCPAYVPLMSRLCPAYALSVAYHWPISNVYIRIGDVIIPTNY